VKTVEGSSSKKSDPNEESLLEDELLDIMPSLEESEDGSGMIGLLGGRLFSRSPCLVVVELDELQLFPGSPRITRSTVLSCGNTNEARVIRVASFCGVFLGLWVPFLICNSTDVLSRTLIRFLKDSECSSDVPGSYTWFTTSNLMLTLGTDPFCSVVNPDGLGFQASCLFHRFNESIIACCLHIKALVLPSCSTSLACLNCVITSSGTFLPSSCAM